MRYPQPVNIFLYHVKISSFGTSMDLRDLSTSTPSESMTRYVGILDISVGLMKVMSVVNLLLIAPGNRTLLLSACYMLPII